MTKAALNILGQDEDGIFLMVEGGAVDWAAHANATGRIIEEQIDFNKSVKSAVDWVR
jgi:alkaline phosphatase